MNHQADAINIHTRTGNHVIEKAMWSAGCLLVGDGVWEEYADLIVSTYYTNYGTFYPGMKVGCVTINRQHLQQQMLELYEDPEAVDVLLVSSRCEIPRIYLERCTQQQTFPEKTVRVTAKTELMSLPCGNGVDARSIPVTTLEKGDKIDICGSVINTKGQIWHEVLFFDENCYIPGGNVEEIPPTFWEKVLQWFAR